MKSDHEKSIERSFRKILPLYDHVGLEVEKASEGEYRCRVPLNDANSNHFGTIHAAIQFAVAEALGGLVLASSSVDTSRFLGVVKRFEIDFRKPATTGIVASTHFSTDDMQSIADSLRDADRSDFELDIVVESESGETIAQGRGFYAVRRRRAF